MAMFGVLMTAWCMSVSGQFMAVSGDLYDSIVYVSAWLVYESIIHVNV